MFRISVIAPLLLLLLSATVHGEVYLGEVRCMAINFTPIGFHKADGALLSISQNTALFSLLGTTYGGDGWTTFALPNLSGLKTKDEKGKVDCFIAVSGIFPSPS